MDTCFIPITITRSMIPYQTLTHFQNLSALCPLFPKTMKNKKPLLFQMRVRKSELIELAAVLRKRVNAHQFPTEKVLKEVYCRHTDITEKVVYIKLVGPAHGAISNGKLFKRALVIMTELIMLNIFLVKSRLGYTSKVIERIVDGSNEDSIFALTNYTNLYCSILLKIETTYILSSL